jgi:hypothetical protein
MPIQSDDFLAVRRRYYFGFGEAWKQCSGTSKRTGERCRATAAFGTEHCRHHLTPSELGSLNRKNRGRRTAKNAETRAAIAAALDAPLELARLEIFREAVNTRARARLVDAFEAARQGDGRAWRAELEAFERRRHITNGDA